uniref:Uncharacterized protein n=1 Tax=Arundo donax TaxID=35708 RepID=A0A0A9AC58_ARUDO
MFSCSSSNICNSSSALQLSSSTIFFSRTLLAETCESILLESARISCRTSSKHFEVMLLSLSDADRRSSS